MCSSLTFYRTVALASIAFGGVAIIACFFLEDIGKSLLGSPCLIYDIH